jgi:hypothetical protein
MMAGGGKDALEVRRAMGKALGLAARAEEARAAKNVAMAKSLAGGHGGGALCACRGENGSGEGDVSEDGVS